MIQTKLTVDLTRSREYHKEASQYTPGGAPDGKWWAPDLIYMTKAKGSHITDLDGNDYIDYHCGAGPIILGHAHPEVNQAVIETIQERGNQFAIPHPLEIELAKKLRECIPGAEMSAFSNAGTDASQFAVRVARTYTGRPKIVKFEGGYQGWADVVALSTAPKLEEAGPASSPNTVPDTAGALPDVVTNTIVMPYNNLEAVTERVEREKGQIACIIVEPYIHGCNIKARPGFLQGLRELCDATDVLLVFDEIVTGFRHGIGGMQRIEGITPDLSIFGKAMANGYPISALVGKRDYMSVLYPEGPAFLSGTFNGNPMSSAAAHKTIEILERPGFYERLYGLGDTLREEINRAIRRLGLRACAVGYGSVWYIHFQERPPENFRDVLNYQETGGREKDKAYRDHMLNSGIFIYPARGTRSYICGAHTEEDVQRTVDAAVAFLEQHREALR